MSTLLEMAREGRALELEILDMHGHLGHARFAIPDTSPAAMVASMDRLGIRSIVCSHMTCMGRDVEYANAEVLAATRAFPKRILGYVAVYPADPRTVRRSLSRWLGEDGFVGLKLHSANGFDYTDAAYEPAYALAARRRLPILFHTWATDGSLPQISRIAERHGEAPILLAHSGAEDEAPYIGVARRYPNVYLELCLSKCPRGLIERFVDAVGAEKLVWGSDCHFISNAQQLGKVVGANIPEQAKRQILADNARRILDNAMMD